MFESVSRKILLNTTDGSSFDITERVMNDFAPVLSTDYRRNMTYVNELMLECNNEDGYFDTVLINEKIEVVISYSYPEQKDFNRFGGFIDKSRTKKDSVLKKVELYAVSYIGELQTTPGGYLTTKYFDGNGMILYNIGVWLVTANVTGYMLKNGFHTIETQEGGTVGQARLDDGDWYAINYTTPTIIYNALKTQAVEIFSSLSSIKYGKQTIIVKNEGEQYPETYFYFASAFDIAKKCFELINCSEIEITEFTIHNNDGTNMLSVLPNIINYVGKLLSMVSNGDDKIYISIEVKCDYGTDLKYQLWELDIPSATYRKIFETTMGYGDYANSYELILSKNKRFLYFFSRTDYSSSITVIKFDLSNEFSQSYGFIDRTIYDYTYLEYIDYLDVFVFAARKISSGNKYIVELYVDHEYSEPIITEKIIVPGLAQDGFSKVYEVNSEVWFYYIIVNDIYRRKRGATNWEDETLIGTYPSFMGGIINCNASQFTEEGKILVYRLSAAAALFIDVVNNTISGNIIPAGYYIASGFESNGRMYVVAYGVDKEVIGYYQDDIFTIENTVDGRINLLKNDVPYTKKKRIAEIVYNNETIRILSSSFPSVFLIHSNYFIPAIFGEYDTGSTNLYDVLQEIANNFLAYFSVDPDHKGTFISRKETSISSELTWVTLNTDYRASNTEEKLYNDKYDRVKITAGDTIEIYGDMAITAKELSIPLELIPPEYAKSFARYFYDYYNVKRKLIDISYLPHVYYLNPLDEINIEDVGSGIIHKVEPKKNECNLEVIINE